MDFLPITNPVFVIPSPSDPNLILPVQKMALKSHFPFYPFGALYVACRLQRVMYDNVIVSRSELGKVTLICLVVRRPAKQKVG